MAEKLIPAAGWREYLQWLLGRRRRFVVREKSMVPTLMPGDTVLAELKCSVNVGDIALVRWCAPDNVSRITASCPNLGDAQRNAPEILLVKRVSEIFCDGGVYLVSDNASEPSARDSRHFGVIEARHIIGRVTSRLAALP